LPEKNPHVFKKGERKEGAGSLKTTGETHCKKKANKQSTSAGKVFLCLAGERFGSEIVVTTRRKKRVLTLLKDATRGGGEKIRSLKKCTTLEKKKGRKRGKKRKGEENDTMSIEVQKGNLMPSPCARKKVGRAVSPWTKEEKKEGKALSVVLHHRTGFGKKPCAILSEERTWG